MAYLQIQNNTSYPFITVNQYYNTIVKCGIIIDARNYGITNANKYKIFYRNNGHTEKLTYDNIEPAFNEYDITLMRQNNEHIFADNEIIIKTSKYCYDLPFDQKIQAKMFHFPNECINDKTYYTNCANLGGTSEYSMSLGITIILVLLSVCVFASPIVLLAFAPLIIGCCLTYSDDKN